MKRAIVVKISRAENGFVLSEAEEARHGEQRFWIANSVGGLLALLGEQMKALGVVETADIKEAMASVSKPGAINNWKDI